MGESVNKNSENRIDAAALGGGVVAIAMTMFADEAPFAMDDVAIALTLWALILGYMGAHRRGPLQSVAVATVLAIISVPIWGAVVERGTKVSSVSPDQAFDAWLMMALMLLLIELIWQAGLSAWDKHDAAARRTRASEKPASPPGPDRDDPPPFTREMAERGRHAVGDQVVREARPRRRPRKETSGGKR